MYLADLEKLVIHDLSFVRYECKVKDIPMEKRKKIYSIQTVQRMIDPNAHPRFNGCPYCMAEYHTIDFTKLFR